MANPYRGEARLEVGNVVYTLVCTAGTVVAIEEKMGKGFPAIFAQMADPERLTFTLLRFMLWSALQERHKEITLDQAGDMIFEAGGMAAIVPKISEASRAAFTTDKIQESAVDPLRPSQSLSTGSAI